MPPDTVYFIVVALATGISLFIAVHQDGETIIHDAYVVDTRGNSYTAKVDINLES